MVKRNQSIVGLDIDASGVTAVRATYAGRITVDQVAFQPLGVGVVRDGEVAEPEALALALRTLFQEHKELGKRVRIGVANAKIVVRIIELPILEDRKELEAAVRFQAQSEIPMPLEQAVLDYQPLDRIEVDGGRRQRVLLVAARRDMVSSVLQAVRSAGLQPVGIDLAAFALIRALGPDAEDDEHVLYVSVAGLTNLAVARGRMCLFTRASSGGLEAIAQELADRQRLTLQHASAWLEHVGLDEPIEDVNGESEIVEAARQLLQEGVRRIAAEVRNSLDFHRAQGVDFVVSRAVLAGPATAVPGFAQALGDQLNIPVEAAIIAGDAGDGASGRLAVAAGLTLEEVPA